MKLTEKCSYLLDFFIQNNFINHIKHNKETNHIFRELYQDVYNAYNNLINLKGLSSTCEFGEKKNNLDKILENLSDYYYILYDTLYDTLYNIF